MATPTDPYLASNFTVEVDSITIASFASCTGLSAEATVIEYREGTDRPYVRKIPGLHKFNPIVLKRGITDNRELWDWWHAVTTRKNFRRNGSIIVHAEDGSEAVRWNFFRGWPARWEGPRLRAKRNAVAIERLHIVHEGLERA
jgi:phage tail-like protein